MVEMVRVPANHRTVAELIHELQGYDPQAPVAYGLALPKDMAGAPEYDAWFVRTAHDVNRIGSPVVVIYFEIDASAPTTVIDPPQKV